MLSSSLLISVLEVAVAAQTSCSQMNTTNTPTFVIHANHRNYVFQIHSREQMTPLKLVLLILQPTSNTLNVSAAAGQRSITVTTCGVRVMLHNLPLPVVSLQIARTDFWLSLPLPSLLLLLPPSSQLQQMVKLQARMQPCLMLLEVHRLSVSTSWPV
jgi:hypothetical protein